MDVIFALICVGLLSESSYFARHGGKPLPFSAPTKVIGGLVGLAAVAAMLLMLRAPMVPSSGSRVLLPTFGWALPDWAVVLIMLVGFGENAVLLCKGIVGQSRMIPGRLKTAIEYSPLLVIALGGAYVLHAKSARRHAAVEAAVAARAMERAQYKGVASAAGSTEVGGGSGSSGVAEVHGPRGSATIGALVNTGGHMSNAAPVVAAMAAGFRNCYSQALAQHPGAEGKVLLSINIGPSGAVQSVNAVPSGSLPESVVDCTKSRASLAQFSPPRGGSAVIQIPVSLGKQ